MSKINVTPPSIPKGYVVNPCVGNTDNTTNTAEAKAYTDNQISTLKDGVDSTGDTLKKLRGLITAIQTLLNSNDANLDTLQEVVTYIKNNATVLEGVTINKVNVADIVDDLVHTDTNKPLSANQGKQLKALLDALTTTVASGAPKAVSLVSQMTDTTKNYVYTGSESGYIAGNWYYWNGSAWVSGGIYQSTGIGDNAVGFAEIQDNVVTPDKTNFIIQSVNIFNKDTVINNSYLDDDGSVVASSVLCYSDYIPVRPNQTITITVGFYSCGCAYDKNKKYLCKAYTGVEAGQEFKPFTFTIPNNAYYIRLNMFMPSSDSLGRNKDVFMVVKGNTLPSYYIPYFQTIPYLKINETKWNNKTWNVIGDSITEHNSRTNYNYQDYIAQEINCIINNYGVSGTGWRTPSTSGGTNAIYERISAMNDADLITVFAGTNDYGEVGLPFVLGTLGDTTTDTFYGAVDYCLNLLINKYPTKTIAVFTPLPDGGMWGVKSYTMQQVADAIIQVANKYSIPVLDLFRINNLNINNSDAKNYYFKDPSGNISIHPNDNGHQKLKDKILAFLKSL